MRTLTAIAVGISMLMTAACFGQGWGADKKKVVLEAHALVAEHYYDADRLEELSWDELISDENNPSMCGNFDQVFVDIDSDAGFAVSLDINRMLDRLGASHTAHDHRGQREYYDLIDIFSKSPALRDDVVRLFPPGGVVTVASAGTVLDDSRTVNPTEEYLEYMTDSATVIERDGARLGYVRIYSWAGQRYQDRLEELLAAEPLASADGVVLDIRGGWGGASPEYLDLFDAPAPVLTMIGRDGVANEWDPSEGLPERSFYWRKPVVLLVDGGSRSGKEIIAYAFKKHGVGPVVGERTAGAVLAGRPFILSDGSLLYLAVADVLVDGERLEGVGVEPDIIVARDLPFSNGADPQLDAAYDALLDEIESR